MVSLLSNPIFLLKQKFKIWKPTSTAHFCHHRTLLPPHFPTPLLLPLQLCTAEPLAFTKSNLSWQVATTCLATPLLGVSASFQARLSRAKPYLAPCCITSPLPECPPALASAVQLLHHPLPCRESLRHTLLYPSLFLVNVEDILGVVFFSMWSYDGLLYWVYLHSLEWTSWDICCPHDLESLLWHVWMLDNIIILFIDVFFCWQIELKKLNS